MPERPQSSADESPAGEVPNRCAAMDLLPGPRPGPGPRADSPLAHAEMPTATEQGEPDQAVRLQELKFLGHLVLRGNPDNAAFVAGVERVLGVALPKALQSAEAGELSVRWISPDEWLIVAPGSRAFELERDLRAALDGHYAIVNVSGGQTVLTLSGPAARQVIRKSTPYDVHDRNFPVGKVVTTVFAKSQAVIRRTGEQSWELIVRRSFADYIWRWLLDACGEFSMEIAD